MTWLWPAVSFHLLIKLAKEIADFNNPRTYTNEFEQTITTEIKMCHNNKLYRIWYLAEGNNPDEVIKIQEESDRVF